MSISQYDAAERDYPTSDGRPMAETDRHRNEMVDLIQTLQRHFAAEPMVCVSGNLLLIYEEGNRRKHISPDVFVVRGVPKRERLNSLVWREGKGPDFVIELTSKSTRAEDRKTKLALYRDVLHVPECILFDPLAEYLKPPLQGFRLVNGQYEPIAPIDRLGLGRLPGRPPRNRPRVGPPGRARLRFVSGRDYPPDGPEGAQAHRREAG